MLKATKVRIYPNAKQADFLNRQFGSVRFVYNTALHIISHRYHRHAQSLSAYHDIKKLLPIAKRNSRYAWLKESDSVALAQACINLDKAFKRFFKEKKGYPRFKSRRGKQSSYHCMSVSVGDDWIRVPKCSPIRAKVHRHIEGKLKSITRSRTATGKYDASLLHEVEQQVGAPLKKVDASKVVGIDMGLTHLLIDSTGKKIANPRYTKKAQRNLKRKQQALSRKVKGSARRAKARLKVAKVHERVANARNDYQHKLSRQIVDDNQAVIVETLKVSNMLKNRKLARHIADAGWHALLSKLDYKASEQGKRVIKLNQWFASSKTCHCCGYKMAEMSLKVRSWRCPECGVAHDRDVNAAINLKQQGIITLKAEGLSVSAHGGLRQSSSEVAA